MWIPFRIAHDPETGSVEDFRVWIKMPVPSFASGGPG